MKKIEIRFRKVFDLINKLFRDNKELIKTAALPLVIGAAVLFFWFYGADDGEIVIDGGAGEEIGQSAEFSEESADSAGAGMYVDISGEVLCPGVYQVSSNTRLFQVIELAGGLTEKADLNSLNQAEIVYDGQKIIVPSRGGTADLTGTDSLNAASSLSGITNGKVNLNLADSATLQTIPGIGPSKAERILDYRNTKGRFENIRDIMNITGIGEKTFESIKDYITV